MLIGGLDVGTTGCKLTVYDEKGRLLCNAYREYDVIRESGRHEIDADVIFGSVCEVIALSLIHISRTYMLFVRRLCGICKGNMGRQF